MPASESKSRPGLERLTPRERECLALVAEHWRTKEIARRLGLSPDTVNEYVGSAVKKLGAEDRSAAARVWLGLERPRAAGDPTRPAAADLRVLATQAGSTLTTAAKWSLMIGGALAGVVLLVTALSETVQAWPLLGQMSAVLGPLVMALVPLGCAVAYWRGGFPEQLASALLFSAYAASTNFSFRHGPEPGAIVVDLVLAAALAAIAFGWRRPLLQAAAALCVLNVLTHFAVLGRDGLSTIAYITVLNLWTYGILALVAASAFWRARRPDARA